MEEYREKLVEAAVELDEAVMERYLEVRCTCALPWAASACSKHMHVRLALCPA